MDIHLLQGPVGFPRAVEESAHAARTPRQTVVPLARWVAAHLEHGGGRGVAAARRYSAAPYAALAPVAGTPARGPACHGSPTADDPLAAEPPLALAAGAELLTRMAEVGLRSGGRHPRSTNQLRGNQLGKEWGLHGKEPGALSVSEERVVPVSLHAWRAFAAQIAGAIRMRYEIITDVATAESCLALQSVLPFVTLLTRTQPRQRVSDDDQLTFLRQHGLTLALELAQVQQAVALLARNPDGLPFVVDVEGRSLLGPEFEEGVSAQIGGVEAWRARLMLCVRGPAEEAQFVALQEPIARLAAAGHPICLEPAPGTPVAAYEGWEGLRGLRIPMMTVHEAHPAAAPSTEEEDERCRAAIALFDDMTRVAGEREWALLCATPPRTVNGEPALPHEELVESLRNCGVEWMQGRQVGKPTEPRALQLSVPGWMAQLSKTVDLRRV